MLKVILHVWHEAMEAVFRAFGFKVECLSF